MELPLWPRRESNSSAWRWSISNQVEYEGTKPILGQNQGFFQISVVEKTPFFGRICGNLSIVT
jgi:hypothetical protein